MNTSITEKEEDLVLAEEKPLEEDIKVKVNEVHCQGLVLKEDRLLFISEYQNMALKICEL